jgi:sugar/nucleoside kinase (ribokinase family)
LRTMVGERPEKLVFVDSRAHMGEFDFGTLKPNREECLASIGVDPAIHDQGDELLRKAVAAMVERTGRAVFCTLSERGILVTTPNGPASTTIVPAPPVRGEIDIVGAGDSATAGIVASLLCGASEIEAAAVGNLVASITIEQLGTTGTATPEQVVARGTELYSQPH